MFLNFRLFSQIEVEHIENFYKYSEVKKWTGQWANGSGIALEYTRENGKMMYHSIEVYNAKWAGYVSAENENVEYWYTENKESRFRNQSCITTNEKEIALITKEFFTWYRTLNLPKSICNALKQSEKIPSVFMVKEIEVNAFGNEVVLRVMSDKNTFLIFNSFPPQNCKLTKRQVINFENLLMDITKKKVIHDDRELFIIFDDSEEMIVNVVAFLESISR